MVLHRAVTGATLILGVALSACTTSERTVQTARSSMVGLSQADVRMCAGFPQRTSRERDGSEIWSYEASSASGGVTVSAPVLFGAASTSVSMKPGGGSCKTQVRFVDGMAVRVSYAGDNDSSYGRNTVCAPIVAACVDYAKEGEAAQPKLRSEAPAGPVKADSRPQAAAAPPVRPSAAAQPGPPQYNSSR